MANNYLQFSFVVPGFAHAAKGSSEELHAWVVDLLTQVDQDEQSPEFNELFMDFADCEDLGFSWDISDEGLSIWAEENGNTDHVTKFLCALLQQEACKLNSVGFTYGESCSRMRGGEFSGGAVFVSRGRLGESVVEHVDARDWLGMRL